MSDDFFAPPPFDAALALVNLKRSLRDLHLTEHAGRFELRGLPVATLGVDGPVVRAQTVKQLARTPDWVSKDLHNAAEVRHYLDGLKALLAKWNERDD